MCGIFCSICCTSDNATHQQVYSALEGKFRNRGPDKSSVVTQTIHPELSVTLGGHVLFLQGNEIAEQPYRDSKENLLLWNGEVFGGLQIPVGESDTVVLSQHLSRAETDQDVLQILSSIHGPWAIIYLQVSRRKLWFGRDVLGRRSFLWACTDQSPPTFFLSSVGQPITNNLNLTFQEVPADGIYYIDLNDYPRCTSHQRESQSQTKLQLFKYRWHPLPGDLRTTNPAAPLAVEMRTSNTAAPLAADLQQHINSNCEVIKDAGSIQSPICEKLNSELPTDELKGILSSRLDEGIVRSKASEMSEWDRRALLAACLDGDMEIVVDKFVSLLGRAVERRVRNQLGVCRTCLLKQSNVNNVSRCVANLRFEGSHEACTHSKVAVLFSGGVDSTLIAALADKFVPDGEQIDLLNVAFQQNKPARSPDYDVPDRLSGKQALEELRTFNPRRSWNFVQIDVTKEELELERKAKITALLQPCRTVLDDSIGCAVWFAARGRGFPGSDPKDQPYTSPARVVLVGMGADEQLGGYSRHAGSFQTSGWPGLLQEISKDVNRIATRNLGRDDRVISDHGREARFPFLDEEVVCFLNSLPMWQKANLHLPRGVGDKLPIRLAALRLGLNDTAVRVKRAIQFGSRIAKTSGVKMHGDDFIQ